MWKNLRLSLIRKETQIQLLAFRDSHVRRRWRGLRDSALRSCAARTRSLSPFALGALLGLFGSHAAAAEVSSPTDVDRVVTVDSVHGELGHVTGIIRNRSSQPVLEVTLLIQQSYLWPNEFKPNGESPSRAVVRHIQGPIAPGQSLQFEETLPLPEVSRGTFETQAMILGYQYQDMGEQSERPPTPTLDPTGG